MSFETLAQRLVEQGADVRWATPETLSQEVIGVIAERGWHRLVSVRRDRVGHPSVLGDDPPLGPDELGSLDAVITETALAVADSGAVILDHGPGQARPQLIAAPAARVCVVERVVVTDVEARTLLGATATWLVPDSGMTVILVDTVEREES